MDNTTRNKKRRYMTGIDGLRALAVIGVIIYHLNYEWLPGGFLGVTIFFVLSGYLITDLLIEEWKKTNRIDLIDFWIRRFKRLLPAFVFMMLIITLWIIFFHPSAIGKLHSDFLPSILYVNNWWYIYHEISYFETFGKPSPFTHLWSLAVEEQFYLFWPIVFMGIFRLVKKDSLRVGIIFIGAIVSALLMTIIYVPGVDPSRVYYGTDTRAFSLLIGAALAVVWPSQKLSKKLPLAPRMILELIGLSGITLIIVMFVFSSQYESFLYNGGMFVLSIYTALLVACLAHPATTIGKIFSFVPLRWIGTRSYAIYLWHYPIIILTTSHVHTNNDVDFVMIMLQIAATLVIAEFSYQFIERPIRRGYHRKLLQWVQSRMNWNIRSIYRKGILFSIALIFYLLMSGSTYAIITKVDRPSSQKTVAVEHETKENGIIQREPLPESSIPVKEEQEASEEKDTTDSQPAASKTEKSITIIGDSIIYDVVPHFQEVYPNSIIDYKVGRQMVDVPNVIEQLRANGQLGEHIILEIGTNGPFQESILLSIIDSLNDAKKIYLVNTRVPRPWQNSVNQVISNVSQNNDKLVLVDWYRASEGKPSYFGEDGVHLSVEGGKAFADLLIEHLNKE